METRRSKRLHSNANVATPMASKTSVTKKRAVSNSSVGKNTKSTTPSASVMSDYFDSKTPSETSVDQRETKTGRKTKSSYFESPIVSEESDESDYEPNAVDSRSTLTSRKSKSNYFESSTASESSESNYESDPPAKKTKRPRNARRPAVRISKSCDDSGSDGAAFRSSVPKSIPKRKNTYESESDSSTDGFEKAPDSLLDLKKMKSPSPVAAKSPSDSENEETIAAENTAEYFDFTAVLSQVTEVKKEGGVDADEKPSVKQPAADAKPKRGKKSKAKPVAADGKSEPMEVFELLAMGENTDLSANDIKASVSRPSQDYEIPKQVEVLLDAPVMAKKRKCNDLEMALRRRLNNIRRENQIYVHKVHVLCWIAHGNYVNAVLNSPDILSVALSLLPSDKCYPPKRMSLNYLEDLMNWFGKKVKLKKDPTDCKLDELSAILPSDFQKLEAGNKTYFCFMFLCLLRALGIRSRLVVNLNVAPVKPTSDQLLPVNQKKDENETKSVKSASASKTAGKKTESTKKENKTPKEDKKSKTFGSVSSKSEERGKSKVPSSGSKSEQSKRSKKSNSNSQLEAKEQSTYFKNKSSESRRSTRLVNSNSKYFEGTSDDEKDTSRSRRTSSRNKKSKSKAQEADSVVPEMSSTDESDFEETFKTPKKKKIDRRVLSSEEEVPETKTDATKANKDKTNYWMEVFLEAEEKWFCVDIVKKNYHCTKQLYVSILIQSVRYMFDCIIRPVIRISERGAQ